jgi:two-component system LytT family response regulator
MIRTALVTGDLTTKYTVERVLSTESDVQVVGESENQTDAAHVITRQRPELLVLDLDVVSTGNIHLLNLARIEMNPMVVVIGKSDTEADAGSKKFGAVDYVVKPVTEKRLRDAIGSVRKCIRTRRNSTSVNTIGESRSDSRQEVILDRRLVFKSLGRVMFLDMEEVDWIEASANYVRIHSGNKAYIMRESIGNLADRLEDLRVHRSIVVNFAKVRELQTCNGSEYIVVLRNGKELPCSRGYRRALDRLLFESVE